MSIIDSACKSFCKCNYNTLDDSAGQSEGYINYDRDIKGNEFRLLLFIILLMIIAKMIF